MNLKEGTRRLALLLGVVGAILGGFASYLELQSVTDQRARHNRFEQLANSDVVQLERKLLPPKGELSKQDIQDLLKIRSKLTSGDPRIEKIDSLIDLGRFQYVELPDGNYGQFPADAKDSEIVAAIATDFPQAKPWLIHQSVDKRIADPFASIAEQLTIQQFGALVKKKYPAYANRSDEEVGRAMLAKYPQYADMVVSGPTSAPTPTSEASFQTETEVNKEGIKTIHWTKDYGAESIETEDGQTLYPTPAPSAWLYLLIALFPILGFFIPWGAARAIGWVGAGFTASAR
jgi:hypothetical protein